MNIFQKRQKFKKNLQKGKTLRFVGSFSPLASQMIAEAGFEGIYVSGAVLSSDLGLPDLELTTLTELTTRGGLLVKNCPLPGLADADTGFGGPLNVARTVRELDQAGFCGLHLEDQKSPKKCGHLNHKQLISTKDMQKKIESALVARTDPNFLISARTDARGGEGLKSAIARAKSYVSAGAEAIFPEALKTLAEFEQFRQSIPVPLIANMTEFGKSELLSFQQLKSMGYNMVLYPVTIWRLALNAVALGLKDIQQKGHQKDLISKMLTREQLYQLLKYNP